MNTKRVITSGCFMLITTISSFAQTLQDAIKLTNNEQFEKAEQAYQTLLAAQPTSGEVYYYYGENFYKNDEVKKAKETFQKGMQAAPESPYPIVGLGSIQWAQGELDAAKANFTKAIEMEKSKNPIILMKVAEAYTLSKHKDLTEAFNLLERAQVLAENNPEVYILLGDAYLEQNNGTKAIENYEKAEELDKSSVRAILRQGQLYNRARNYNLALDLYKKASLVDSSFAPAYREKAEIYARAGQFANAVKQYQRYLELNNDCDARGRYAGFLFQAKEYALSIQMAQEAQQCDPDNVYLYRYLAYSQYENKDYSNGMKNSDLFFQHLTKDINVIALDYEYRGKLYAKLDNDSLAVIEYQKAMDMDTASNLSDLIATSYMKLHRFDKAAEAYASVIKSGKGGINDYYGLGRAYYYGKDFINADTTFGTMMKMRPELPLSYLWRAKAQVQLDSTSATWAAKPYYEAFIAKMTPELQGRNIQNLVNAHTYLAAYYAKNKDLENTKAQFQKVLELDPANAQAKKFLEAAH